MRWSATLLVLTVYGSSTAQLPAPKSAPSAAPFIAEKFPVEWYSEAAQDPYHPLPPFNLKNARMPTPATPFSAVTVMSSEVSLAGQPPSVFEQRGASMRDSVGRTRTDEQIDFPDLRNRSVFSARQVEVNDPVSHCSFRWIEPTRTDADKQATVQCFPRSTSVPPDPVQSEIHPDAMEIKMTRQVAETTHPFPGQTLQIEPLGHKVVAGMDAFGVRQTLTDPSMYAGVPLVTEIWWSSEIKEILLAKPIGDPAGRLIIEMTDIKRGDPDPALFYPPAGYKILTAPQMSH